MLGDQEGSETCIKHQEEIKSNTHLNPYYLSDYVTARSMYSVSCLEEAVNNGDSPVYVNCQGILEVGDAGHEGQ